jgi:SAM-dependent methyltransferase
MNIHDVSDDPRSDEIASFVEYWSGREGGQERANYQLFIVALCDLLRVERPNAAEATRDRNNYVFERAVEFKEADGTVSIGRIDLYRRGAFVLEAKQSRQRGGTKAVPTQLHLLEHHTEPTPRGRRSAARGWDVLMLNARRQAEAYAKALPTSHGWPPFILVCDVGHCIEVYADFSGQGKNYAQFPDRQGYRIYLEDLRQSETRDRLRRIWIDPQSLDPSRVSARVTRDIAERLAAVSKALELAEHPADAVAMFLMRCLFTMFAEDVGLLPRQSFRDVLSRCENDPSKFAPMVGQLWEAMDRGGFAYALETKVKQFNGEFFRDRAVLPLGKEEIGELRQAASADWRDVEPAIFGTLLEQALEPSERKRLGAHYTPRDYVERLVVATIIEPLRSDWAEVLSTAERQKSDDRAADAVRSVRKFHEKLCQTRVLDPACGTGNFLYVALELLKRLEGEVLEALLDLGGQEALLGLERHSVDPHQFLGMELNPRASAIAELVLWIGYLQWHFRTKGAAPSEPILRAFKNIEVRDAVLSAEIEIARDARGEPFMRTTPEGRSEPLYTYNNPRRPEWPKADFVVGNPPFIGGKDLRTRLGEAYAEALWSAHPHMNESADYVMYWWDHAADLLVRRGTTLRRFGLVTTNSITQVFQRKVVERHLAGRRPISLAMAIADHPWTKATKGSAAVRIAMTVGRAGIHQGVLREVTREEDLETDRPHIVLSERVGKINADLTIGVDVTSSVALRANEGLCSPGIKLHGAGFLVTAKESELLGVGKRPGLKTHIREYRNGRDLMSRPRRVMVIDLFGLTEDAVRARFPEIFHHLLRTVKPERQKQYDHSPTKDALDYLERWWLLGARSFVVLWQA